MNRKDMFRWVCFIVIVIVFLTGCTGQEPVVPDMEIPESVTIVSPDEFYPYRNGLLVVVFQNKLWVFGQGGITFNQDGTFSIGLRDVWNSEDGIHWDKIADRIFEDDRIGYRIVVFKNKLWAIGGIALQGVVDGFPQYQYYNEIWNSEDGVIWDMVTEKPDFSARSNATIVTREDGLWMFGGIPENGFRQLSEVWRSRNGTTWDLVTDKLSLTGIRSNKLLATDNWFMYISASQGIWSSTDGETWNQVNISESTFNEVFNFKEGLRSRAGYASTIHNGQLYVLGGWNYPTNTERYSNLLNDVWRTSDGEAWERMSDRDVETDRYMDNFDTFPARTDHSVVSFRGMLYLTGGYGDDGPYRDAWVSIDGKTWYELARVQE